MPTPMPAQRPAQVPRNQTAQHAPMPVIEKIHLMALDLESRKELCRLLRAADPRIGVVRAVRVATQPFLVGYRPALPVQLFVTLEFLARKTNPVKQVKRPGHRKDTQAQVAQ